MEICRHFGFVSKGCESRRELIGPSRGAPGEVGRQESKTRVVGARIAAASFQKPLFPKFSADSGRRENAEFRTLKQEDGMALWNSQVGVPLKRFLE